jgi:hypothetical protein
MSSSRNHTLSGDWHWLYMKVKIQLPFNHYHYFPFSKIDSACQTLQFHLNITTEVHLLKEMKAFTKCFLYIINIHQGALNDRMIVWFTTTYAISAYHHWCFEFKSWSGRGVQHYVIKFVSNLRQVCGFFRFPPPMQLTTTI